MVELKDINPLKLNLGAGWDLREGYLNVDGTYPNAEIYEPRPKVYCVNQPIQPINWLPNGCVDEIMAMEVIEHFANPEEALAVWGNKLKPGGKLTLSFPDYKAIVRYLYPLTANNRKAKWDDAVNDYMVFTSLFGASGHTDGRQLHSYATSLDGILWMLHQDDTNLYSTLTIHSLPDMPTSSSVCISVTKLARLDANFDRSEHEMISLRLRKQEENLDEQAQAEIARVLALREKAWNKA